MNEEILKKYNISFFKNLNGSKHPDGKTALSSYLYIWRQIDDVDDFLIDIDICLNGNYGQLTDRYWSDMVFGLYGELTQDSLILSGPNGSNPTNIPLNDFKEILLSWRAFLSAE
ncbi:hypothetical protein ACVW0P_000818 [Mucilaginibacter sp. UYNi724]